MAGIAGFFRRLTGHGNQASGKGAIDPAQAAEDAAARAAIAKVDADSLQAMQASFYSLALSSLERAKFAAQLVQTSSAAIATLYSGILALVFSASGRSLPVRGLITPLFLGIAVVMSTAYISYMTPAGEAREEIPIDPNTEILTYKRLFAFMKYVSDLAARRAYLLRGSVVALGIGLTAIASPFLATPAAVQGPSTASSPPPAAETTSVTAPAWPTPLTFTPSDQAAELYKAQVAEAAEMRRMARLTAQNDDKDPWSYSVMWVAVGVVLILVGSFVPDGVRSYHARHRIHQA